MKAVAIAAAALLSAAPGLALADGSGSSGSQVPITTVEQAAAAMAAPFAFQTLVPLVETATRVAEAAAQAVRAAAAGVDPEFLAIQTRDDGSARRKSLARQALRALAQGASRAAQERFGTAIPATDVPCQAGGFFTLRGTPGPEYLVQVQYQGCRTTQEEVDGLTEINGSILVGIFAWGDLTRVTRVRFGAPGAPYVETSSLSTGFLTHRLALHYAVVGPLADSSANVSPFAHRIGGSFVDESFDDGSQHEPGVPFVAHRSQSITFDDLVYAGVLFNGLVPIGEQLIAGREAVMQSGALASRAFEQDQFGNFFLDDSWAIRVNGLRIVDKTNHTTSVRTLAWDGRLNLAYPQSARPGCVSGEYGIRTPKPILISGGLFSAGLLQINDRAEAAIDEAGTATLKFEGNRLPFSTFTELLVFGDCVYFP